jgi:adenine-specific DNA-methyltransferase
MSPLPFGVVHSGDCQDILASLATGSVDMVLTDPPYLCRYRTREGVRIANDDNGDWMVPVFAELHRVLKDDSYMVSFYGWQAVDQFMAAWKAAGFRPVEHLVFPKRYASSVGRVRREHEMAYLLAKGRPPLPREPIGDVLGWSYTGNRLHPTQKPLESLEPLVATFCPPGGLVLDPFCGSGSSLVAAVRQGREALGIELEPVYAETAMRRLLTADVAATGPVRRQGALRSSP